jgi:hypothetical protein
MNTDYNCFVGKWPEARAKQASFDELRKVHEKHGIAKGVVSSLDSVLYNDPLQGDLELFEKIRGTGYGLALSINPTLPNVQRDMKRADDSIGYEAFRIYPSVHGYGMDSPKLMEFMDIAAEKEKPVLISCTFGDARLDYMIRQRIPETADIGRFLRNTGAGVVLCNLKIGEAGKVKEDILSRSDVHVDMSELKHSLFSIRDMGGMGLGGRLVFGSFFPLFDFGCSYIHFRGEEDKKVAAILSRDIFEKGEK